MSSHTLCPIDTTGSARTPSSLPWTLTHARKNVDFVDWMPLTWATTTLPSVLKDSGSFGDVRTYINEIGKIRELSLCSLPITLTVGTVRVAYLQWVWIEQRCKLTRRRWDKRSSSWKLPKAANQQKSMSADQLSCLEFPWSNHCPY